MTPFLSYLSIAPFFCDGPVLRSNLCVLQSDAGVIISLAAGVKKKTLFLHAVITVKLLSYQLQKKIMVRVLGIHSWFWVATD